MGRRDTNCNDGEFCSESESKILVLLKSITNYFILLLILALLILVGRELFNLFAYHLFNGTNIKDIVEYILFIFILIELFTILYSYLKKGRIKVERVIEVGIISLVREIIVNFLEIETLHLYALSTLLLVFGVIFFVEKYFSNQRELS